MTDPRALAAQIVDAMDEWTEATNRDEASLPEVIERVLRASAALMQRAENFSLTYHRYHLFAEMPYQLVDDLVTYLRAVSEERDRLHTREATYHSLIAELQCLIEPDDHPDVQARVDAVLVECENPVCALEAERDRLADELLGSQDAYRDQGEELLRHIRLLETAEAERDRLRGALATARTLIETIAHAGYGADGIERCHHCLWPWEGPHDEGCSVKAGITTLDAVLAALPPTSA